MKVNSSPLPQLALKVPQNWEVWFQVCWINPSLPLPCCDSGGENPKTSLENGKICVELSDEVALELQKCLRLLQLLSFNIKKLQCPVSIFFFQPVNPLQMICCILDQLLPAKSSEGIPLLIYFKGSVAAFIFPVQQFSLISFSVFYAISIFYVLKWNSVIPTAFEWNGRWKEHLLIIMLKFDTFYMIYCTRLCHSNFMEIVHLLKLMAGVFYSILILFL